MRPRICEAASGFRITVLPDQGRRSRVSEIISLPSLISFTNILHNLKYRISCLSSFSAELFPSHGLWLVRVFQGLIVEIRWTCRMQTMAQDARMGTDLGLEKASKWILTIQPIDYIRICYLLGR
jgi:hypothetical protein